MKTTLTAPSQATWWQPRGNAATHASETGLGLRGVPALWARHANATQRKALRDTALAQIEQWLGAPQTLRPLAETRQACSQAAARGDLAAAQQAGLQALAGAALQWQQLSARKVPEHVRAAALVLMSGGACELWRAEERHLALTLAAVPLAFTGRPCHVVVAQDQTARHLANAAQAFAQACGLSAAAAVNDMPPLDLCAAYACDLVFASGRRLAADLAHDMRQSALASSTVNQGRPAGRPTARVPLTRGVHTLLLDDLDRQLIDEVSAPVMLVAAEDPAGLGDAIAQSALLCTALTTPLHYSVDSRLNLIWTDAGQLKLAELALGLAPVWREASRCNDLFTQALLVRDHLTLGRDFEIGPQGQLQFDDTLALRLPLRNVMTGLTQAVQLRHKLPVSPVTRTIDRVSLAKVFAGAHHLAGLASSLDGLASELRQTYRLEVDHVADNPPGITLTHQCLPTAAAAQAACLARSDAGGRQLFVLRKALDVANFERESAGSERPWVLASTDPAPVLHRLGLLRQEGSVPATGLELVFPEPLDSWRAELAFVARVANATDAAVSVRFVVGPSARLLQEQSGPLAPALGWLGPHLSATRHVLPVALRLARHRLATTLRQQRASLLARELQLRQQLSFAGVAFTQS